MDKYESIRFAYARVLPQIVGKPLGAASKIIEAAGLRYRLTRIDGVPQMITADVKMDRLNLHVSDGVVVEAN